MKPTSCNCCWIASNDFGDIREIRRACDDGDRRIHFHAGSFRFFQQLLCAVRVVRENLDVGVPAKRRRRNQRRGQHCTFWNERAEEGLTVDGEVERAAHPHIV